MPNAAEHQAKCDRNRAYLDSGIVQNQPDWAVVVAFYTQCILWRSWPVIERPHPLHHANHQQRELWLSRRHRAIFNDYETLRDASQISRYGTLNQFNRMYTPSTIQSRLIDTHLAAIERYVGALFLPPPNVPPVTGS